MKDNECTKGKIESKSQSPLPFPCYKFPHVLENTDRGATSQLGSTDISLRQRTPSFVQPAEHLHGVSVPYLGNGCAWNWLVKHLACAVETLKVPGRLASHPNPA